jgi:hypothetical protein
MGAEGPAPSGALDSLQISGGACRRASLLLAAARTLGRRLAGLTPARITMAVLARLALDLEDDALLLVEGTDQRAAVRRLLGRFRRRRLDLTLNVTAADLMAAGVPRGPELAQRLAAIRRALLSGRPAGRHLELGYALSARPRSSRTGNRGEV